MTANQAIKKAKSLVGTLFRNAPKGYNQWKFHTYDERARAYRDHHSCPYQQAVVWRREELITQALIALGWTYEDASNEAMHSSESVFGLLPWQRVVREATRREDDASAA